MSTLSRVDLTWLACAIDGEGHIGLTRMAEPRNRRGFSLIPVVTIGNTSREFIEYFVLLAGGKIRFEKRNKHNEKSLYRASIYANRIRQLLPTILPYLIIKRKQATLLLEALRLLKEHRPGYAPNDRRPYKIFEKMRELNRKGVK